MSGDLGGRIKQLREQRRWSQQELGDRIGVSTKTVSNWERGRNDPRASMGALVALFGDDLESESEPLPPGAKAIGDPSDELVEFRVSGAFGVQAVVKGPIRDIDALQEAVSKLIAGMRTEEADEA
jgi:putative transcriptional regulator